MAATGFGIVLLRKSKERWISARQKFKTKWVSFFTTTATATAIIFWWQAEKYKKFFDPFPCVEVSRLISISSQKV